MSEQPATRTRRYFVLTQDVTNPLPDRRSRHDWRDLPVWRAGMGFVQETWSHTPNLSPSERRTMFPAGKEFSSHEIGMWSDDLRFVALSPYLQERAPNLFETLDDANCPNPANLLCVMLARNPDLLALALAAGKAAREMEDGEYTALLRRNGF